MSDFERKQADVHAAWVALAQSAIDSAPVADQVVFKTVEDKVLWTLLDQCCTVDAKQNNRVISWVHRPLKIVLSEVTQALLAETSRGDALMTPALDIIGQLEVDANRMYAAETAAYNIGSGHLYATAFRDMLHAHSVAELVPKTDFARNQPRMSGVAPWLAVPTEEFPQVTWAGLSRKDGALDRLVRDKVDTDEQRKAKMAMLLDESQGARQRKERAEAAIQRLDRVLVASENRARFDAHRELQIMWRQFLTEVSEDNEKRLRGVLLQTHSLRHEQLVDFYTPSKSEHAPARYQKEALKVWDYVKKAWGGRNRNAAADTAQIKQAVLERLTKASDKYRAPAQFQQWAVQRALSPEEQKLIVEYNSKTVHSQLQRYVSDAASIVYESIWTISTMIQALQQQEPQLFMHSGTGSRAPSTFQAELDACFNAAMSAFARYKECSQWIVREAAKVKAVRERIYKAAMCEDARRTLLQRMETVAAHMNGLGDEEMQLGTYKQHIAAVLGVSEQEQQQAFFGFVLIDGVAKMEHDLLLEGNAPDEKAFRDQALVFVRDNAPAMYTRVKTAAEAMHVLAPGSAPDLKDMPVDSAAAAAAVAEPSSYAPIRHSREYLQDMSSSFDEKRLVATEEDTRAFKQTMQAIVMQPLQQALSANVENDHDNRVSAHMQWRPYYERIAYLRAQLPPSLHDIEHSMAINVYPACITVLYFVAYRKCKPKPLPQSYTDAFVEQHVSN